MVRTGAALGAGNLRVSPSEVKSKLSEKADKFVLENLAKGAVTEEEHTASKFQGMIGFEILTEAVGIGMLDDAKYVRYLDNFVDEPGDLARWVDNVADDVAENAPESGLRQACFPAGTTVATENGSKAIQDVEAGDRVWACDAHTGRWELKAVVAPLTHSYDGDLVSVTVGDQELKATGNHPFWVVTGDDLAGRPAAQHVYANERGTTKDGRWVEARDLVAGDVLLLVSGKTATIAEVASAHIHLEVYNIEVDGFHTYAVGPKGILVHNKPAKYTAGDQISGKLKRSPSYHSELANNTVSELEAMAKQGGQAGKKAKQMLKLIKQGDRLRRKMR